MWERGRVEGRKKLERKEALKKCKGSGTSQKLSAVRWKIWAFY